MAVNKNFVVKNGLEVDTNLILADATTNRVGIGTSVPQYTLHVFEGSGIGATNIYVTGVTTVVDALRVGHGGTVFSVVAGPFGIGNSVGVGTAQPAYLLDVRAPVSTGQTALYVQGDVRITGDLNIEDDINIDEVNIRNLNVTGLSTFVGYSTFRTSVAIQTNLYVGGISTFVGNINNIGGGATIGNIQIGITDDDKIDTRQNILVLDSGAGQVTVDDRLRVTGIGTFDTHLSVGGTFGVAGFSTFADSVIIQDNFLVGGISTFVGVSSFSNNVYIGGGLTLAGSVALDTDLYIIGIATIGNLKVAGLTTTKDLEVTGLSTFVGFSTFNDYVNIQDGLNVAGAGGTFASLNVTGLTTIRNTLISGITTITNTTQSTTFNNGALVIDGGLGVEKNVNVGGNLDVTGNITIGGSFFSLQSQEVLISNKDIILGYTTATSPNDNTANHAGVAIASTEGIPLVSFSATGINTLPDTYKQMMWFRSGTLGFSTDIFGFNYGLAIGTTTVASGVRLAVGSNVTVTDTTLNAINASLTGNLNVAGVSTLASAGGITTTGGDLYVGGDLFVKDDFVLDEATARNLNVTGITTTNSLNIGATQVISSGRQLQNIASLDATTTATIEAAIANAPNTFTELKVTGVSTFVGIATFNNGIQVVSGVSTLGVTTVIQLNSTGIVTASSFVPTSGYIKAPDGTNSFYIYSGTGNVAFQGTIGASQLNSASGFKVVGLAASDAAFTRDVSVVGVTTLGTVKVVSGIVTATSTSGIVTYYGDGSNLTGTATGLTATVGIQSGGVVVGSGITTLNVVGTGFTAETSGTQANLYLPAPGVSLGLAIALGG